ncbi:MAG: DUF308 domain-containing protein [Ruminococcus sp.]|nr:DUF308 domain-containing protein [Ruminococcus sp.]
MEWYEKSDTEKELDEFMNRSNSSENNDYFYGNNSVDDYFSAKTEDEIYNEYKRKEEEAKAEYERKKAETLRLAAEDKKRAEQSASYYGTNGYTNNNQKINTPSPYMYDGKRKNSDTVSNRTQTAVDYRTYKPNEYSTKKFGPSDYGGTSLKGTYSFYGNQTFSDKVQTPVNPIESLGLNNNSPLFYKLLVGWSVICGIGAFVSLFYSLVYFAFVLFFYFVIMGIAGFIYENIEDRVPYVFCVFGGVGFALAGYLFVAEPNSVAYLKYLPVVIPIVIGIAFIVYALLYAPLKCTRCRYETTAVVRKYSRQLAESSFSNKKTDVILPVYYYEFEGKIYQKTVKGYRKMDTKLPKYGKSVTAYVNENNPFDVLIADYKQLKNYIAFGIVMLIVSGVIQFNLDKVTDFIFMIKQIGEIL